MSPAQENQVNIIEGLKERIGGGNVLETRIARVRRIFLTVKVEALKAAVNHLAAQGFKHITTISGIDLGDSIGVVYHLDREGLQLSVKVVVPENNPVLSTITDIIPGAVLYEREVHDLLGVVFEGHPDLSRLVLPEKWPDGLYPLRKKHSVEDIKRMVNEVA